MTLDENLARFQCAPGLMPYADLVQVQVFLETLRDQFGQYLSARRARDVLAPENAVYRPGELNYLLADLETVQWYVARAAPPTVVVTPGAEEGSVVIDISLGRPL